MLLASKPLTSSEVVFTIPDSLPTSGNPPELDVRYPFLDLGPVTGLMLQGLESSVLFKDTGIEN